MIDHIQKDDIFAKQDLSKLNEPANFVGLSAQQVNSFLVEMSFLSCRKFRTAFLTPFVSNPIGHLSALN